MSLSLEGKARRRALAKTRSLLQHAPPRDGDPGPTQPLPVDTPAAMATPAPRIPRRRTPGRLRLNCSEKR
jgi:hypothetical protein